MSSTGVSEVEDQDIFAMLYFPMRKAHWSHFLRTEPQIPLCPRTVVHQLNIKMSQHLRDQLVHLGQKYVLSNAASGTGTKG